jgi:hypothetical protein
MPTRRRSRRRVQAEPDFRLLSALVVVNRGGVLLGRVRQADSPPDLVGLTASGQPLLVATVGPEVSLGERLAFFVALLGREDIARHVRRGCQLVVHVWSRRRGCWSVEVVSINAQDFSPAEGERS